MRAVKVPLMPKGVEHVIYLFNVCSVANRVLMFGVEIKQTRNQKVDLLVSQVQHHTELGANKTANSVSTVTRLGNQSPEVGLEPTILWVTA